jgi:hypothetical protein
VFCHDAPVLRGKWVDYSALAQDASKRQDPALFNHYAQITAAKMAGFKPGHMWASAHVVHPLRRSLLSDLFARHTDAFLQTISKPFRDLAQFQPMSLHNHAAIRAGCYAPAPLKDYMHMRTGAVIDFPHEELRAHLRRAANGATKFLCVNDFPQLEAALPESRAWIERAIGA